MAQEPRSTGGPPPSYSLTDDQFAALLGNRGVLTDAQLERIVDALRHRHDLLGSLHRLTKEQEAVSNAINVVGARMGVENFLPPAPPPVVRHGQVIIVTLPPQTQSIRIFHANGVTAMSVQSGSTYLRLPDGVGRIGRIDFLGPTGALLGFTGGQRKASPDECAQIDAVAPPQKRSE